MPYTAPDQNPLDVDTIDYQPEVPPLDEVLLAGMEAHTLELRVCLPCAVMAVTGNQLVDLQPLFQSRYVDGDTVTMPIIKAVPVSMPMGAAWGIKYPIAVGDTGMALFSDRSLDVWMAGQGGIVDVGDTRQHDINDAIFVPGLVPVAKQTKDTTQDLLVVNGKAKLRMTQSGKFNLGNGSQEVLDLLNQTMAAVSSLLSTLTSGPVVQVGAAGAPASLTPAAIASLQQVSSTVQSLQQALGTLKA